ncbi:MAG TPA: hypothetical protein VK633_10340 [Verrucomicrobiae bacterium]|nr:hypothetical protein [Verrucomicrobiae bacterium]
MRVPSACFWTRAASSAGGKECLNGKIAHGDKEGALGAAGFYGIDISSANSAIVESNVIDNTVNDATNGRAVKYANCTSTKFFNNQNTAGQLLRGYNSGTAKYIPELEDAVQDMLLPLY